MQRTGMSEKRVKIGKEFEHIPAVKSGRGWLGLEKGKFGRVRFESRSRKLELSYEATASTVYTYDDKGNILTETFLNADFRSKYTRTYDENGNPLLVRYDDSLNAWTEDIYTYDDKGRMLTKDGSAYDGSWNKQVYTYDANGRVLSQKKENSDNDGFENVFLYDEKGNLLFESHIRDDGWWRKSEYTYDFNGNQLTSYYYTSTNLWES